MFELLKEMFLLEPVALIIGVIGFGIFLPLFAIACAKTDFTAEGQHKAKKNNKSENIIITFTYRITEHKDPTTPES